MPTLIFTNVSETAFGWSTRNENQHFGSHFFLAKEMSDVRGKISLIWNIRRTSRNFRPLRSAPVRAVGRYKREKLQLRANYFILTFVGCHGDHIPCSKLQPTASGSRNSAPQSITPPTSCFEFRQTVPTLSIFLISLHCAEKNNSISF